MRERVGGEEVLGMGGRDCKKGELEKWDGKKFWIMKFFKNRSVITKFWHDVSDYNFFVENEFDSKLIVPACSK